MPDEATDPLAPDSYYDASGSMIEELDLRLPHTGPIYKDDNKTVYMLISKAVAGTSVECTTKSFSRKKDDRGTLAFGTNHARDGKYRTISHFCLCSRCHHMSKGSAFNQYSAIKWGQMILRLSR